MELDKKEEEEFLMFNVLWGVVWLNLTMVGF